MNLYDETPLLNNPTLKHMKVSHEKSLGKGVDTPSDNYMHKSIHLYKSSV